MNSLIYISIECRHILKIVHYFDSIKFLFKLNLGEEERYIIYKHHFNYSFNEA